MKSMESIKKKKKEIFIKNFCKQKGWDPNNLTSIQMLTIVRQEKYNE